MRAWFFFNSLKGTQTEVEEFHIGHFIREIAEDLVPYTFVWQGGWKHWVPLAKVPELMSLRILSPPPPPALGTRYPLDRKTEVDLKSEKESSNSQEAPFELKQDDTNFIPKPSMSPFKVARIKEKERRASKRFLGRLKVMLKDGEMIFRTYTTNASTKGVLLEDPVPPNMLGQQIEMYIYSPDLKSCLRLVAELIEDQRTPLRLKFIEADELSERRLLSWINTLNGEDDNFASSKK